MKQILGRKVGMTQVFTKEGKMIPVTVVEVLPNVVLQKKTVEKDGYDALQVGYEEKRENITNKPMQGIFKKANTTPKKFVAELTGDKMSSYEVGSKITVDLFKAGDTVDVEGVSKGKGFTGVIKRYGYKIGPKAHGSGYHRGIGSMASSGLIQSVRPGKKMAGHHGFNKTTVLNLEVVSVDTEKNAILIKGALPGANKSLVKIRSAVKEQKKAKPIRNLVDYTPKTKEKVVEEKVEDTAEKTEE